MVVESDDDSSSVEGLAASLGQLHASFAALEAIPEGLGRLDRTVVSPLLRLGPLTTLG